MQERLQRALTILGPAEAWKAPGNNLRLWGTKGLVLPTLLLPQDADELLPSSKRKQLLEKHGQPFRSFLAQTLQLDTETVQVAANRAQMSQLVSGPLLWLKTPLLSSSTCRLLCRPHWHGSAPGSAGYCAGPPSSC